jgi:hypothetical protein
MARTTDNPAPDPGPGDTLGPCGCVDYHMADCDVLTGGGGRNTKADWDGHDWDADEGGW